MGLAQEILPWVLPCPPLPGVYTYSTHFYPFLVQNVAPNSLTLLFLQSPGTVCTAPPVATEGD